MADIMTGDAMLPGRSALAGRAGMNVAAPDGGKTGLRVQEVCPPDQQSSPVYRALQWLEDLLQKPPPRVERVMWTPASIHLVLRRCTRSTRRYASPASVQACSSASCRDGALCSHYEDAQV